MKRKLFVLLMAVMMMLGMAQVTMAGEKHYYAGGAQIPTDDYRDDPRYEDYKWERAEAVLENGRLSGEIRHEGHHLVWWAEIVDGKLTGNGELIVDNVVISDEWDGFGNANYSMHLSTRVSFFTENPETLYIDLNYIRSEEAVVHQISTPFTAKAESDRGDYNLAIAGQFVAELADGMHVLTTTDINTQKIAIVAYNKANGVRRVMRENTIEEMTVTVSGGEVTEYVIRGRVQTDGGTLDRYTATIR